MTPGVAEGVGAGVTVADGDGVAWGVAIGDGDDDGVTVGAAVALTLGLDATCAGAHATTPTAMRIAAARLTRRASCRTP